MAPAAVLDTSQGRNDTQGRKASDPAATTFPVPLLVPAVAAVGQVQLVEAPGSWCPALHGSLVDQRGKVGCTDHVRRVGPNSHWLSAPQGVKGWNRGIEKIAYNPQSNNANENWDQSFFCGL